VEYRFPVEEYLCAVTVTPGSGMFAALHLAMNLPPVAP